MDKSEDLLNEIRQNIANIPSDIDYELFDPVGNMTSEQILELRRQIREILEKNPNHVITATYTYGNLAWRKRNIVVKIIHNDARMIINVNPDWQQLVVFGLNYTPLLKSTIVTLLQDMPKFFLFISGPELIHFIDENVEFEESLSNIVYEVDKINLCIEPVNDDFEVIIYPAGTMLDTEANRIFNEIWGYKADYTTELDRPHVTVVTVKNGKKTGVGGARANEVSEGLSVIGGVNTKIGYRRRGIGYLASYHITKHLLDTGNRVFLETDVSNFPARKIYEKIGYRQVGVSKFFDLNTGIISEIIGDRDY